MTLSVADLETVLAGWFDDWRARRYCVALSGGLDSVVLVHLMAALAPPALRAVYVDHQLHHDSADWRAACEALCDRLGVPFSATMARVVRGRGESPEACARSARYAELRDGLTGGEVLLTAHHADDQVETVLLQLLRGAGPAGLAAMPAVAEFGPGLLCRPLLQFERGELRTYAEGEALTWVEDPANADLEPDRNYLRHRVLPLLRARWPAIGVTVARSARHSAAAARLIAAQAAVDLESCRAGGALELSPLRRLPRDRQRNALRAWIRDGGLPAPASRHLERLLDELLHARRGSAGRVEWPGAGVRVFREHFCLLDAEALRRLDTRPAPLAWRTADPLSLGAGLGTLHLAPTMGEGLALDVLEHTPLEVRWRAGGERIRTFPGGRRRRLKSLLREAGVLPWMRDRVPLVYAGGDLVAVADLWLASDRLARPAEPGWHIRWADRPPLALGGGAPVSGSYRSDK